MAVEKWQRDKFLNGLENGLTVEDSAKGAGYCGQTMYRVRWKDPVFAEQWAEASQRGNKVTVDQLKEIAVERARGKSDTLLIFMLKSLDPATYSERYKHEHKHEGTFTVADVPYYRDMMDCLLGALQPHPDAMADVIAALGGMQARIEQQQPVIDGTHQVNPD